jgi:transcriptional regulator with XRE-family HTH domain
MTRSVRRTMDEAWTRDIGGRIKEARLLAGFSQPEMADLLVVHPKSVANYEGGRIPWRDLRHIAEVLNTDMRWLLFGERWQDPLEQLDERITEMGGKLDEVLSRLDIYAGAMERTAVEAESEGRARQSEQTDAESATRKRGPRRKAQ